MRRWSNTRRRNREIRERVRGLWEGRAGGGEERGTEQKGGSETSSYGNISGMEGGDAERGRGRGDVEKSDDVARDQIQIA